MDSLIFHLVLCVILVSVMTVPLGCVGLWNGLSFFGDTLAHASLLGICLSLLLSTDYIWGCVFIAVILAVTMTKSSNVPKDVTLATISYICLAVSLILITGYLNQIVDPNSLLFGDLLSVSSKDLLLFAATSIVINIFIYVFFKDIQLLSFDETIAYSKRIQVIKLRCYLMICYSLVIGLGMKVLGALFIPAMALLPAVSARNISKTPLQMVLRAILISIIFGLIGLFVSIKLDWPTGPAIIVSVAISLLIPKIKNV